MKEYPWGKGTPKWVRDATANDSDKSFTVPAGKVWRLLGIYAYISCTATVGNRVLAAAITDGTNAFYTSGGTAGITASQTGQLFLMTAANATQSASIHRSLANVATIVNVQMNEILPDVVLSAGYVVRVWDAGVADVAADDLTVVLHYVEYDA